MLLTPVSPTSTEVETVTKAIMTPLNFWPEWDKILLDRIATELARAR